MSAEGKVFYINHNDRTTHWTRPDPPPVQPDDSPAEDLPPSSLSGEDRGSPLRSNGGGADAAGSPALSGGSNPRDRSSGSSGRAYAEDDAVAPEDEEEAQQEQEALMASAAAAAAAEAKAKAEAMTLEEVAGASSRSTGVADVDPKMAPSATVVDDPPEESAARSMYASPASEAGRTAAAAATTFARGKEEADPSLGAASPSVGVDPAVAAGGEEEAGEEGGGAGPVSSIVKSGLFGATVARPGVGTPVRPGTGGNNGDPARSAAKRSNSAVPNYASSTAGAIKVPANDAADVAADLAADVAAEGESAAGAASKAEPEVDGLPEGMMHRGGPWNVFVVRNFE